MSESSSLVPRRRRGGAFGIAVLVQCVLLAVTLFVMVEEEASSEPPEFEGQRVAAQSNESERMEQKVREMKRRISKPRSFQRLAVENAFSSELPVAPALPVEAFELSASDAAVFENAQDLMADTGMLESMGSNLGKESATEFFGVRDAGRKIVIVVNTSASVVRKASQRGVSIEKIQEEVAGLVEGLESGTQFGIVQFSQGARRFAEHMAPALKKNKRIAREWIAGELKGNPEVTDETWLGHEAAFHWAMSLRPDLIFIVTDGVLNKRTRARSGYAYPTISFAQLTRSVEVEMRENGVKPRIHAVGFALGGAEREGLRAFVRRFGGTLREF